MEELEAHDIERIASNVSAFFIVVAAALFPGLSVVALYFHKEDYD
jgi:hypothetical protein